MAVAVADRGYIGAKNLVECEVSLPSPLVIEKHTLSASKDADNVQATSGERTNHWSLEA